MNYEQRAQLIEEVIDRLAEKTSRAMKFCEAFSQSLLPSAVVGLEGEFIEVNQALCNLLGYSPEELQNKSWQELTHPEYLEVDLELVRECVEGLRTGYHLKKKYIHKEGNPVLAHLFVSLIEVRGDLFFLSQIFSLKIMEDSPCRNGSH